MIRSRNGVLRMSTQRRLYDPFLRDFAARPDGSHRAAAFMGGPSARVGLAVGLT